jgi:hypothetical protein
VHKRPASGLASCFVHAYAEDTMSLNRRSRRARLTSEVIGRKLITQVHDVNARHRPPRG